MSISQKKKKKEEKVRQGTPRQDLPPRLRRQLTFAHVQRWGLGALPTHPVPFRRWPPWVGITGPLGVIVTLFALGGIRTAQDSGTPFVLYPLSGIACWAVIGGPLFLYLAVADRRPKRRLIKAARDIHVTADQDPTLPGYSGEHYGYVSYGGDSLRLITKDHTATTIPFTEIHFVEELPPKRIWGMPGIDVLTKAGQWTEIRVTDSTELLAALEKAGTPVVRARNYPFTNKYS